ncbi:hypothetical protein QCA50_002017 [Cerrena zonata]|uniref:Uncharacterized protein n=1 Tax=Cerrena zonata TaxID=2478898 RepID=A0AAW0GSN7_9APHY
MSIGRLLIMVYNAMERKIDIVNLQAYFHGKAQQIASVWTAGGVDRLRDGAGELRLRDGAGELRLASKKPEMDVRMDVAFPAITDRSRDTPDKASDDRLDCRER